MALFEQKYPNNSRIISGLGNVLFQDDVTLLCNTSLAPVSITLSTIPANYSTQYKLYIIDNSNNASVNNITILAPVGYLVNGAAGVVISSNNASFIIRVASTTGYVGQYSVSGGGGGGVTNGVNVGTGLGQVFKNLLGSIMQFKTIKAGTNITITNNIDDITIDATGGGEVNTASNIGVGQGVFANKVGADLQFKTLIAGTNITLVPTPTSITINSAAGGGGYITVEDEGVALPAQTIIDFQGAGVTATNGTGKTIVTIPSTATVNVGITGNVSGTQLIAAPLGGTAPYTYIWSEAQNIQNRFSAGAQTQVPSTPLNLAILGLAISGGMDAYGTSVMWRCVVTDSLGNKGVGYFTNVSASTL